MQSTNVKTLKEMVKQITQAKNENNAEKLLELLAPDFIAHIPGRAHPLNREEYIRAIQSTHQAFSHLEYIIDDMIVEKDKIAIRLIMKGKHTGDYQGHEATQHEIEVYEIIMRRIMNGKVVEEWQVNDSLSLLQQIGLSVNHII